MMHGQRNIKLCFKMLSLEADIAVNRICVVHLVDNKTGWLRMTIVFVLSLSLGGRNMWFNFRIHLF